MIVASAMWHQGRLFYGKRHHNCIRAAVDATKIKPVNGESGFITHNGTYLNREQAAIHALQCKQIESLKYSETQLFSEDLW